MTWMPPLRSCEDALDLVLYYSREIDKLENSRNELPSRKLSRAISEMESQKLNGLLSRYENDRMDVLRDLVRIPPHYLPYRERLEQFSEDIKVPYKQRVFIMTKYPDRDGADTKLDEQLQTVIDTVKTAVLANSYRPLLADEKPLRDNVWENLECYMLACARGIAIVENRFASRFNPNIAVEWGWMKAMNKPVLYLVEKDFPVAQIPADLMGLIRGRFDWDDPDADIPRLVAKHLPEIGF